MVVCPGDESFLVYGGSSFVKKNPAKNNGNFGYGNIRVLGNEAH